MTEKPPPQDILERTFKFAQRVSRMRDVLIRDKRIDRNVLNQLSKSSSGVGANLEESKGGQSRADFHSKVCIALKEARESHYWLRLLEGPVPAKRIASLIDEANQIIAILTTIAKKTDPNNPTP